MLQKTPSDVLILEKAIELWADPRRRIKWRSVWYHHDYGRTFCAMGVMQEASKAVTGKMFREKQVAKLLGFKNPRSIARINDYLPRAIGQRYLYRRMKEEAKKRQENCFI